MFNNMLKGGVSWPFIETEWSKQKYLSYYCESATFVLRGNIDNKSDVVVLGTFYIKPNWPGRASGICNGGFITNLNFRGKGIATVMGRAYMRLAKDLGYHGSVFNLVFEINKPSIRIWERLGFIKCGHIPKVARLKGIDHLVDAYQYYFDLSSYDHSKYPIQDVFKFDASSSSLSPSSSWKLKSSLYYIIVIIAVIISVLYFILSKSYFTL